MLRTPVYLHSSWRTGSTYVWAKFRALREAYCYFEPLNEHLASEGESFIDGFVPWAHAHHPKLDTPYLEEYRPLLSRDGGLAGFPVELSYGCFLADRNRHFPELESYFGRLSDFARGLDKIPVFGCVRTGLRVDWFRHHLKGAHVFLLRDPRRQFISYLNQAANGNRYFIERCWVIVGDNRDDPAFAPLHDLISVPVFPGRRDLSDLFYRELTSRTDWADLYIIFYFLHSLTLKGLLADSLDLIIDLDRLSNDKTAISKAEIAIAELTGAKISFADCKIESYQDHLKTAAPIFAALEAKVEKLLG